jgi:hypothetical protein
MSSLVVNADVYRMKIQKHFIDNIKVESIDEMLQRLFMEFELLVICFYIYGKDTAMKVYTSPREFITEFIFKGFTPVPKGPAGQWAGEDMERNTMWNLLYPRFDSHMANLDADVMRAAFKSSKDVFLSLFMTVQGGQTMVDKICNITGGSRVRTVQVCRPLVTPSRPRCGCGMTGLASEGQRSLNVGAGFDGSVQKRECFFVADICVTCAGVACSVRLFGFLVGQTTSDEQTKRKGGGGRALLRTPGNHINPRTPCTG